MYTKLAILFSMLLAPLVAADLHNVGICVDHKGKTTVYNSNATQAACRDYLARNTGSKQWDQCPDCTMKNIGELDVCSSEAWHIGGDELNHYCKKNGAGASMAT
ncbi:hypothetical protein BS50DRAFT_681761 [Corynespora cassiicola Philippines]|uniref:Secreted protein n=1 Tax=Corynespora cassiicola Philippines TaxID=1448308 RepID=A0A2T2N4A7_CORCC|nr:hypothetical protein BS50DRAFT_681761 [Corynespora cassiicola Philippines]